MSEPATIEDRVTKLETEMVEVRYLAAKADKETSENTVVLKGQVGMLNSLRETQLEHDETLKDHGKRLDRLERKVDDGFADMRSDMRRGFRMLSKGQVRITELLEARDDSEDTDV